MNRIKKWIQMLWIKLISPKAEGNQFFETCMLCVMDSRTCTCECDSSEQTDEGARIEAEYLDHFDEHGRRLD
jgi:hypothetical protein